MANSLWTQMVFFFLTTEYIYYLLIISIYMFFNIIIIISLPDIIVKTKHQNWLTMNIPSPVFMLIYNNSASPMLLVCNLSHNIKSSTDLSNNSLSLNNHRISFLQTSSRNSYYSLSLTLFWLQSTSLPSRQSLSLPMTPSHLWTQHICLSFICFPNMVFLSMSSLAEAQSLY